MASGWVVDEICVIFFVNAELLLRDHAVDSGRAASPHPIFGGPLRPSADDAPVCAESEDGAERSCLLPQEWCSPLHDGDRAGDGSEPAGSVCG